MTKRRREHFHDCEEEERFFPVNRVGHLLIIIGLALAFLSFIFGFWLAIVGAILVVAGFIIIQWC